MKLGEAAVPRLQIFDREQGRVVDEVVWKGSFLLFHYGNPLGRSLVWLVYQRHWYSKIFGVFQRTAQSRRKIDAFVRIYGVRVDEADRPLSEYTNFNEFFIRRLKPGARPIDPAPDTLIAPSDGRVLVYPIEDGTAVPVKGRSIRIRDLVGESGLARKYNGGTCMVVRLMAADYHRFHYMDEGKHGPVRELGGALHSVHPFCLQSGVPVFAVNYRHRVVLETQRFGDVVQLDIGAMRAGKIVQVKADGGTFARGDEKGWFEFGASCIVLLFEPGRVQIDDDIQQHSRDGIETLVRMGTRIGRKAGSSRP